MLRGGVSFLFYFNERVWRSALSWGRQNIAPGYILKANHFYARIIAMDPELKELLRRNLAISEETNNLLKKMHSAQKWGRFFRLFYWLVIISLSLGAYYYLQGPLEQLLGTYKSLLDGVENVQKSASSLPDVNAVNSLLQKLRLPQ